MDSSDEDEDELEDEEEEEDEDEDEDFEENQPLGSQPYQSSSNRNG